MKVKLIVMFIILLFSILVLSQTGLSSKENFSKILQINNTDYTAKYDSKILEEFNKGIKQVEIKVDLRKQTNILVRGTKEERKELSRQIDSWFQPVINEVLNSFSEDELKLTKKTARGFRGEITKKGFDKLIKDPRIEAVYYGSIPVFATLDDSVSLIKANDVWDLGRTGEGITVCVIDSGVNASHPDLNEKIVDEYCYCTAPDTLLSSSDCCPDGSDEDDDAEDYRGHGTHVVGIIASQDSTYKGVAYDADIYVVKVLNSSGRGDMYDIGDAIDWCRITANADVISISIGNNGNHPGVSSCPSYIDSSINAAYNADISVITASGNEEYTTGINYPACSPNAISVGATTKVDVLASYTNTHSTLDLLAPGSVITSLRWDPNGDHPYCTESGEFMTCSGTSMAAPHVSGAAALLLEADPSLAPDEIKTILDDTGEPVDSWQRIDVLAALNSLDNIKTITVSNTGDADLSVTSITDNRAWITSIAPTSFIVSVNSSQNVSVTINPDGYSPDEYTGTISIYSNDPDEDPKTVTVEMNIAEYEDGESCSSDSDCESGYCDSDGVGLSDDDWCFTPYDTYFDGEEQWYCEYSTDQGIADCDEREEGDNLDKCVGLSYYVDECSSSCGYIDDTSTFECLYSGCSCSEPLCHGLTTGSNIANCSSGQTYFADKCTSTAGGEDRSDNICRDSTFAADCTADSLCNGVEAGTNGCSSSCEIDDTYKFYVKDQSNNNVAWLGDEGNIVLKGTCTAGGTCTPPANSFIIRDINDNNVSYIDSNGNLCLTSGTCNDDYVNCDSPGDGSFIVRNESDTNVAYINATGNLCLIGSLIENGNP